MHSSPSDVIAEQVRKHRKRLGLTREQLAEECARLGADHLTFAALTNIETGRRDRAGKRRREVTVDELEVLAHALAVPLLLLIFPVGGLDRVPTIPLEPAVHPRMAWKSATGAEPPVRMHSDGKPYADRSTIGGPNGPTRLEAWRAVVRPIELYQQLSDETDLMIKATGRLTHLEQVKQGDSTEAQHLRKVREHHLTEMARLIETMMDSGIRLPSYDPQTAREIIETGLLTHPDALPSLPASAEDA
ncbi:helix-turn-helix transcriptional regulator [Nonomuraea sp. NPDC023979]|uniref:helix-turn-helix domain-containing protein n=1 Tax=Nonomuraea sp. NPDC023979 TaxID=3154796 RepID=UPI0033EC62A4